MSAVVQVAIYNVLWFAVPIAALALAILRPGRAPEYLERATALGARPRAGPRRRDADPARRLPHVKGAVELF